MRKRGNWHHFHVGDRVRFVGAVQEEIKGSGGVIITKLPQTGILAYYDIQVPGYSQPWRSEGRFLELVHTGLDVMLDLL